MKTGLLFNIIPILYYVKTGLGKKYLYKLFKSQISANCNIITNGLIFKIFLSKNKKWKKIQ